MNVPLLDLKPQYLSLKREIDEVVSRVVESQYFIMGPEVEAFERECAAYLDVADAVGVSSGTDALLVSLMALDIQPGDEAILPDFSFFATAGVAARMNATPVFADIDPVTFNISPADVERKITPKTKAIIPVHLFGQSADMDAIMEIARRNNIAVVEDAAQAIGVEYSGGNKVGGIGDLGCFSFFPSKNLGGFGDGGLVTTNDKALADKIRLLRNHGAERRYFHKIIGGNFRLDALQAAVLRVKLPRLDDWSHRRRENAALYEKLFVEKGLSEGAGKTEFDAKNKVLLPKAVYESADLTNFHIYNQYTVRFAERDKIEAGLKESGVGCAVYYPVPFSEQECFAGLAGAGNTTPNSRKAAREVLSLPVFPDLTGEQIKYVVETIEKII